MMAFSDIIEKQWMLRQLDSIGLKKPTPIQANCIPPILTGRDCVGCAQTGSGKTLAFALPILHRLSDDPYGIFALVLTPTRELAFQIADQFRVIGKSIGLRDCVVVGGRDMVLQGQELSKKPHVVIATPGRLADHLESCDTFSLKKVKFLVMDEADRLLEETGGFEGQLETIFAALPAPDRRQTLLFSATLDAETRRKAGALISDGAFFWPEKCDGDDETSWSSVKELVHEYVLTPFDARDAYLVNLIQLFTAEHPGGLVIVFAKTCRSCQLLSMTLNTLGFPSVALHSMKPQRDRMAALSQFRSLQVKILVATDVASRGLDIPQVQLVINHNVPSVTANYIHRVGRTARAGRSGKAVTLVTPTDVNLVKAIEELAGVTLSEYDGLDDSEVANIHVQVGVTRREQDIKLSETDFDEKRNINKRKRLIRLGQDPDEVEREKQKRWKREKRARRKQNRAENK